LTLPVLLVRPDGNDADRRALVAAGITVMVDPYLQVVRARDEAPAAHLLRRLAAAGAGDWLMLTSPRALAAWGTLVAPAGLTGAVAAARLRGMRVAAVGAATAASVRPPADLVGTSGAAALVDELRLLPPGGILFPHGRLAAASSADSLAADGWTVTAAVVYDTVPVAERPPSAAALSAGRVAAVLLRSASAVAAIAQWADVPAGVQVIAVGRGGAAARAQGWDVVETAPAGAAGSRKRSGRSSAERTRSSSDLPGRNPRTRERSGRAAEPIRTWPSRLSGTAEPDGRPRPGRPSNQGVAA
jgi:uroporphyrinogen-III synthase